jgi:misacylated tRNA(Ala) deacylase
MTELLYQTDSYCKSFDARITGIDEAAHAVVLDRTAFYPGGGGQPCDFGTLTVGDQTYRVTKVQKQGADVLHIVEGDPLPNVGDAAHGELDWDRRYKLMRTHTMMHILCGVIWHTYGTWVTGSTMDVLNGRMDFELDSMHAEFVRQFEEQINAEVAAARDIRVQILPREQAFAIPDLIRTKINLLPEGIAEVRTVEIVGLDLQADGGTHVANTSEVGRLRVVDYKSKGKINKRVYVELEP